MRLLFKNIFLLLFLYYYYNNINAFEIQKATKDDFCTFPVPTAEENVDKPKEVKGEVDFKYVRLMGDKLINDCSINGSVNGKHIISIEDGGKISNLILGNPGKGIWCKGSCTLENVYWEKVCYHAAGFSGSDDTPKIHKVIGGAAINAPDKFFTQSSKGKTIIENFCGHNFGKVYCSCGSGCKPQYERSVEIKNSKFKGPGLTLISLNHNYKDTMLMSNNYIAPEPKIDYICQEYNGTTEVKSDISPTQSFKSENNGDGQSCKYSTSNYSFKQEDINVNKEKVMNDDQKENKQQNNEKKENKEKTKK